MIVTRRQFLRASGLAAAGGALLGRAGAPARAAATDARKPNVILIMADDCGYELFKAYGGESHRTSVLDALAAEGVVFENCYATPLCTPTRVSIMTGKYNHRNYKEFGSFPKADERRTFGNMMKQAGYATCMAGKWQLKGVKASRMGFDAHMQCDCWGGYWATANVHANDKPFKVAKPTYRPDIVNRFVLDFIQANRDRPFFVYYPMFLIHHPEQPSPDHPDKALIEKCKRVGREEIHEKSVFPDMVTYMDKLVGKVVRKLDELGIREKTVLMFTGDNGTCVHRAVVNGRSVGGGKGSMRDSGTRVPLIVNWPGTSRPAVLDDLVDITDFYATFADLAGVRLPPPLWASGAGADTSANALDAIDGVSFLPQLQGKPGTPRKWAFVLFDRNGCVKWRQCLRKGESPPTDRRQGAFWARTERWKLYGDGRLFDVRSNLGERKPILPAADTPETAAVRKELAVVFGKLAISQDDLITFDEYKRKMQGKLDGGKGT